MHIAVAVGAVLDLATLELARPPGRHRWVTVPVFGVRHQTSRSEDPAQAPDQRHHVGSGDGQVEVELAGLDLSGEIVRADDSAPASRAPGAAGPVANTATRTSLPVPDGRATVPRTI